MFVCIPIHLGLLNIQLCYPQALDIATAHHHGARLDNGVLKTSVTEEANQGGGVGAVGRADWRRRGDWELYAKYMYTLQLALLNHTYVLDDVS